MSVKFQNEIGTIDINADVISTIAGISAIECYGLVGMASKSPADGFVKLLKRDNMHRGVKVHFEENQIIIDLYVIVQFGTKISVVANNIRDKVKYSVENQTGIEVKKVNINIEGVRVLEV
ncbi:Asp23/Gls24 family envelope stress response protein [Wukongibacter baidiensis]|uniref:Asp23/Gls24 family envelope stress response protein n=1 Tax=Wukongibacter baidiensis TaxID=1723361 RepID=UPI003D7FB2F6